METCDAIEVVAVRSGEKLRADILAQIDALQEWFASRPYGFRDRATSGQLQQFADREREYSYLCDRLESIGG